MISYRKTECQRTAVTLWCAVFVYSKAFNSSPMSVAAKNGIIENALKKVVEPMGHTVVNYGMYSAEDEAQLTYVQIGILAAVILEGKAKMKMV